MRLRARIAAVAVLASAAGVVHAKQPHAPSEALQILPDETESFTRSEGGRTSALTGRPLALYRVNYPVRPGTPEQMAREYLAAHASQLGVAPDASDLRFVASRYGLATTTVGYGGASDVKVHFGLGRDELVKTLTLRWPSGTVQVIEGVEANQVLLVEEPEK